MADRYFKRGRQINVSMNDLLGSGGQANVVMVDGMAVKLWKTPDQTQIRKVEYYLKNPPKLGETFLFPLEAITNDVGAMVGYEMRPLPNNFKEGGVLFNKTLRLSRNITTPTLLAVIDSARNDLEKLHGEKIVCGDVSGRNFAFVISGTGIKTYWYDTDAYQVAGYPCPVWTEFFLCPDLYKYAYSTGSHGASVPFSEESDNYSFATILFWSLFNTNPYMQTHLKYPDFKDKAANGIWLLDSGVIYPKNLCPPPDVLSDSLLGYFEQVFKKHKYLPLQHQDLVDYSKSLIECPSCQTYYPNTRSACPKCTIKTAAIDFVPQYKYERLLETNGQILFAKYQHGNLYVVSKEKKGYFVSIRPSKGQVISGFVPLDLANDYRFDIVGDSHLLVNGSDSEGIFLTPIADLGTWITTTTAIYQGNRQATFRGTAKGLYRLAGDQLMLGEVKNGYLVDKVQPAMFSAGQTWFWSDAAGDRLVSMSRFFSRYQYQLINSRGRLEMEPTLLEETDSILEMSVMFGDDNVCMRRVVNRKGRSVILTDAFDSFGKSLLNTSHFVSRLPGQDIQQVAYNNFKVYWPTDTGIVVEDLKNNSFTTLSNTEKIADSDCHLIYLAGGSHFLVVREHKVNYLML